MNNRTLTGAMLIGTFTLISMALSHAPPWTLVPTSYVVGFLYLIACKP